MEIRKVFQVIHESKKKKIKNKIRKMGNSLMVQVLRLHALSAEGPGLIPSLGTKIPQTAAWSKKFRIM